MCSRPPRATCSRRGTPSTGQGYRVRVRVRVGVRVSVRVRVGARVRVRVGVRVRVKITLRLTRGVPETFVLLGAKRVPVDVSR